MSRVLSRFWLVPSLSCALLGASTASADGRSPRSRGADVVLAEISQNAVTVRVALRQARHEHDPLRAKCVSKKLSEVHAQMRIAEQHAVLLAGATSSPRTRVERHVLKRAYERSREIARDARHFCGGTIEPELKIIPPRGAESRVAKR
jgi:hypothetical protein